MASSASTSILNKEDQAEIPKDENAESEPVAAANASSTALPTAALSSPQAVPSKDEDAQAMLTKDDDEEQQQQQRDSFFIRKRSANQNNSSKKAFLMRVKQSQRELESSDEDDDDAVRRRREGHTHPQRRSCCPSKHRMTYLSHRLRRLCCCRSINVLRLADTCFCGFCCCCCASKQRTDLLVIRVPVRSIDSLIDDDSPFAFPRINQEVLEYILEKTWDQITYGQPTQITVETLHARDISRGKEVSVAFSNTFRHEAKMQNYELIRTAADGSASCIMSIGIVLCLLAILLPLNILVVADHGSTPGWLVPINGLIIVVLWIAVWHPVELLIYGRHMIKLRRSLCRTLADSKVIIVAIDPEKADDNNDYDFDEIDLV